LIKELKNLRIDVSRIEELFNIVDNKYIDFDLSIVRGLAYYTDIVFEAFSKEGDFRAIFGGGEYNNLISDFGGEKTPAVGVGFGEAVLIEVLKSKKLIPEFKNDSVFIATIGDVFKKASALRNKLMKQGLNVDLNLNDRNLSKQFQYAQAKGINTVYIVGNEDKITIKDLKTGKEKKVKI